MCVVMVAQPQDRSFGPFTICGNEVFTETPLSFAFVNLKPVVPGLAPSFGSNVHCTANMPLTHSTYPVVQAMFSCLSMQAMFSSAANGWSLDL